MGNGHRARYPLLTSTCLRHHFVTIDGKATVSYIPKDSVIGLSKLTVSVQFFAQRPQVQERLTQQILIALQTLLGTNSVAVSIDAVHYCVKARGIRDATSATTATSLGGLFQIQSEYAPRVSARCASSQLIKGRNHGAQRHARFCSRRRHCTGILLLNISAFGLPKAAYLNPARYGAITPPGCMDWAFLDLIGR